MDEADRQLVRRVPLFLGLRPRQLQAFLRICRTLSAEPREVLCELGTSSTRLFILLSGRLDVEGKDGTVLARISPVTTVGEMGFVSRKPRSATVRATEASRLFVVEHHDFETLVEADAALSSRLYRNMARILADRLSEANDRLTRYRKLAEGGTPASAEVAEPEAEDEAVEASGESGGGVGPVAEGDGPEEAGGGAAASEAVDASQSEPAEPAPEHSGPQAPGEPKPAPARRGPPIDLDEAETARLVVDFYTRTDQAIDPAQLRRDQAVVAQLGRDGYSVADIEYAILWTVRSIPTARRFSMVGLSIGEAFENR